MATENKNNKFKKIRDKYRKYAYTQEKIEALEQYDKLPYNEKKQIRKKKIKTVLVNSIFALVFVSIVGLLLYKFSPPINADTKVVKNITKSTVTQRKRTIESGEVKTYMIDKLNNVDIKIAQTKLGDKVAYSVTYNCDTIAEGELVATKKFDKQYVTTVLINGFPYLTHEQMGLNTDEEAYLATQLAVYEIVSIKQYKGVANGMFSLDKIEPSEEQYKDMVSRVVSKAKELAKNSIENMYVRQTSSTFVSSEIEKKTEGDETIIGPFYTKVEYDEYAKKFLGDSLDYSTNIKINSYIPESQAVIIDEDGNEVDTVKNGSAFYAKIIGNQKYFAHMTIEDSIKGMVSRIYSDPNSEKQYTILEDDTFNIKSVTALTENVETGTMDIDFKNVKNEDVSDVEYNIYNEQGEKLLDIDGFSSKNIFVFPLGKYYIQEYKAPKDYLLNQNKYEVNLIKPDEEVKLEIKNQTIESLLLNE